MSFSKYSNLPNSLTISRLVISFFLPILMVYLLPFNIFYINILLSIFFILFSLTDFFDGYLARRYKLETKFGKVVDPIADKFFIIFSLIALLSINKIYFLWVIIFIGRELFIMGLRQIALENNFNIHVSFFGKLKTAFQVIMLAIIIANPDTDLKITYSYWNILQLSFILFTMFLTLLSAYQYYKAFKLKYN